MQIQEELLVVSKDMIMKGKRTKRQRLPSPLRIAMPSSTTSCSAGGSSTNNSIGPDSATTTTSSPTNNTNTTFIELRGRNEKEDEDIANCLMLLAQGHHHNHHVAANTQHHHHNNKSNLYLYQCKTCNRCFPSFQALGGHRASHKKPMQNGTTSTEQKQTVNEDDRQNSDLTPTSTTLSLQISNGANSCGGIITAATSTKANNKVHECSICGAEFSSGQALGGHMRRHRTSGNVSMMSGGNSNESQEAKKPRNVLSLDLNLPAPEDDHRESKFSSFQPREKVIVFSTSSLVDCHY
ncbi:hypothetical protein RJT34_22455 [Clitoria ternatea]|uniref:C2H2-type domain-containing protein n=1 Tax=Clitoria ternatea TaxID=43366 RepID=A0AAN9FJ56_CLITE